MNKKEVTLKEFIEDNYKLLSAIGVFVALFIFFSSNSSDWGIVSFIILFAIIILCWELMENFPEGKESKRLSYFEVTFGFLILFIVAYTLSTFEKLILILSLFPLFLGFMWFFSKIIENPKVCLIFKKLKTKNKKINSFFELIGAFTVIGIIGFFSILLWALLMIRFGYQSSIPPEILEIPFISEILKLM